jgi:hypothetical protein
MLFPFLPVSMRNVTSFPAAPLARLLAALLLALWLGAPAHASTPPPATGRPLAEALNPDGTLKRGANGSFDARQFHMGTAPDGRPVFRPAGTKGAGDERWSDGFGVPNGTNGHVLAVVRIGSDVYIGGIFTAVGLVSANNVARWNGATWSSLGTGAANGVDDTVYALAATSTGDVYVGGNFTQAGGAGASYIARWNGAAWSPLGSGAANGTNNTVYTLAATSTGDVYVGGNFTQAGGAGANFIARWNGTGWSPLSTGLDERVQALAIASNGDLYVGGLFSLAGNINTRYIAKWNGISWNGVGNGYYFLGSISSLAIAGNGDVYAAHTTYGVAGGRVGTVSKWNGAVWSAVGTGTEFVGSTDNTVSAIAIASNGDVYAGGQFSQVNGTAASNLARWNGTAWSAVGTGAANGTNGAIYALTTASSGDLYVGGVFAFTGGTTAYHIAKWNGTAWSSLGTNPGTANGMDLGVFAVAVAGNGDVYVGGGFSAAGGVEANNVARWNGTAWSSLGTGAANGVNNGVVALAVAGNGDVYVGGDFTKAGGVSARSIARWNGTAWSSLGSGIANGTFNNVTALAVAGNGDVYVGGSFYTAGGTAANNIARWNGTTWSSLGTGVNNGVDNYVNALAIAGNGTLYVGGRFTSAGGVSAYGIARWNGTTWSPLGTGVNNTVNVLAVAANGDLYAGGYFTLAGGTAAARVARWNGTAWSSLGTGVVGTNTSLNTLVVAANGDVYAGGYFTTANGAAGNNIARWNGIAWSNLGTGTNKYTWALSMGLNGKLYVGGGFTATGDGSKAMSYFGIYDPAAPLATTAAQAAPAGQLFPNPAHGTATLRLPATAPRLALTLTDALGRVVRRYPAPADANAELDLRGLPAGTYLVRCGAVSQRLVVE